MQLVSFQSGLKIYFLFFNILVEDYFAIDLVIIKFG